MNIETQSLIDSAKELGWTAVTPADRGPTRLCRDGLELVLLPSRAAAVRCIDVAGATVNDSRVKTKLGGRLTGTFSSKDLLDAILLGQVEWEVRSVKGKSSSTPEKYSIKKEG